MRFRSIWCALICALVWTTHAALSTPATAQSAAMINEIFELYNEHTEVPVPTLDSDQMAELLSDSVVKVRRQLEPTATGDRKSIVSYYIANSRLPRVWVAALDPHFLASERLMEVRLSNDAEGNSTWYQHFSLPWPVQDRHWMIDVKKGIDLCKAADGAIWEHAWNLSEDGEQRAYELADAGETGDLRRKDIEKAVYLPANTGAWVMAELPNRKTLIVYHVTTVFGGAVPDSWIATFAYPQLDKLLRGVSERAKEMPTHYVDGHEVIYGGDGQPVPFESGS